MPSSHTPCVWVSIPLKAKLFHRRRIPTNRSVDRMRQKHRFGLGFVQVLRHFSCCCCFLFLRVTAIVAHFERKTTAVHGGSVVLEAVRQKLRISRSAIWLENTDVGRENHDTHSRQREPYRSEIHCHEDHSTRDVSTSQRKP